MKDVENVINKVLKSVIPSVIPDKETVRKAKIAEEELRKRLERELKDYSDLEFKFLGSYARNTWLAENLEIDAFILFPESYDENEMEKIAIKIGKNVLDEWELKFASHPYVHGVIKGVKADIVPCFKLKSAERIKSAVDRTPFHHEWLKDRIRGKENDVRLLKKFLKSSNLYGAEYSVKGFSGYLCELLIVFYGSFINLIKNAVSWRRDLVIDVANGKSYIKSGMDKIFVIDPVDKKRNVASNLSLDNLAKFVEKCRLFLANPSENFFHQKEICFDERVLREELKDRFVYAIEFSKPNIVDDNLYPQLERAVKKISEFLVENDFDVISKAYYVGERCYILVEVKNERLSKIKRHRGPPFEIYEHSMKFIDKSKERKYNYFIENGVYWTYLERKYVDVRKAISDFIKKNWRSLGKDTGRFIKEAEVLRNEEILKREVKTFMPNFLRLKYEN